MLSASHASRRTGLASRRGGQAALREHLACGGSPASSSTTSTTWIVAAATGTEPTRACPVGLRDRPEVELRLTSVSRRRHRQVSWAYEKSGRNCRGPRPPLGGYGCQARPQLTARSAMGIGRGSQPDRNPPRPRGRGWGRGPIDDPGSGGNRSPLRGPLRRAAEVLVRLAGRDAAARRSTEEALLQEEGLVDVLEGVHYRRVSAKAAAIVINADGAAVVATR